MRNTKNRSGLAIGAIFALVAGLFGALPAANAATETAPVTVPSVGTGNTVLVTDDFVLTTRHGASQASSGTWSYYIVTSTTSANLLVAHGTSTASTASDYTRVNTTTVSGLVSWYATAATSATRLWLKLDGKTSISSQVTVTVTPYQDTDMTNGTKTNGDVVGDSITITFAPWSVMGAAVTLQQPQANSNGATASFTVTSGAVNYDQLDSTFALVIDSTNDGAATTSARVTGPAIVTGNYSKSGTVATAAFTTSGAVQSVSAYVTYGSSQLTATTKLAVAARTIAGVTISAATGANVKQTGATSADARINSAFTLNAFPHTNSITTSMAVAGAFSVSAVGSSFDLDANSGVIVNGVTYTQSSRLTAAVFTQASGTTTIAVSTFGQDTPDANSYLDFKFVSQLATKTLRVTFKVPTYTVEYTPTNIAGPAGTARSFAVAVKDQWLAASTRTDQRVAASVDLGGSLSATVSSVVSGGAASMTVTPTPATRTGSATITFTLQTYNVGTQDWDSGDTDTATWNVYTSATSDGFVSRTASKSASISYGVALSYSATIAVVVNNSYSDVVASAPGLIIRDADDTTATASGALTVQATNKTANFQFAATKTGTYVVTFTNGSETTTSQIVVDAAPSDKGTTITWDTTQIDPGRTKVVTGTLTDANGNAVNTGRAGETAGDAGTASILVTYYGDAGIVVGSMPTETDADGKFRVSVLTSAADRGTLTFTATYMPQGASTVASKKVTSINAINVGPAAVAAADTKVNAGSFKGYVAIYAKGYEGKRLSAKVGNDWVVVESLKSDFERVVEYTGAGYTIAVRIYIDRVLVDTITVTTK